MYWLFSSDIFLADHDNHLATLHILCPPDVQDRYVQFVGAEIERFGKRIDESDEVDENQSLSNNSEEEEKPNAKRRKQVNAKGKSKATEIGLFVLVSVRLVYYAHAHFSPLRVRPIL